MATSAAPSARSRRAASSSDGLDIVVPPCRFPEAASMARLTSNVRSVSCVAPARRGSVTRHDAERKRKIMDVIAATIRARGYPPSVREIARAVGLASTSAVHHHLQILEKEGYLERGAAQSRAIRLTPTAAIRLGLSSELVPQSTASESRVLPII